jgi:transcription elongation GreA/GreB family factor
MELGSSEHKAQHCAELIKSYHENIWNDEIYRSRLEEQLGDQRKALAAIVLKIEAKGFKSKNEGEKAKFVAEREIEHTKAEIEKLTEKITVTWPQMSTNNKVVN